ncbi:MAG: hypothetical protein HGA28_02650 [Anaerolineaceae bacterium]|nr:hypothetical protein [Anaerolineaceae bacterium]
MKKTLLIFGLMVAISILVAGCTPGSSAQVNTPVPSSQNGEVNVPGVSIKINVPGPNPLVNTAGSNGQIAGTLLGIWHGVISPVTLVWSFIDPNIQMYEVHNDGSQYNLGFLLGVAIVFVLIGIFAGRRR